MILSCTIYDKIPLNEVDVFKIQAVLPSDIYHTYQQPHPSVQDDLTIFQIIHTIYCSDPHCSVTKGRDP